MTNLFAPATLLVPLFLLSVTPAIAAGPEAATLKKCSRKVTENCWVKPCTIKLDFDGDGKGDVATLVAREGDGERGIALLLASGECMLAGAGTSMGNGGSNFYWMDEWKLRKGFRKKRDGLEVGKDGIRSVIYLDGISPSWFQEGD